MAITQRQIEYLFTQTKMLLRQVHQLQEHTMRCQCKLQFPQCSDGIVVAPADDGYYALRLPEAPHRVFKFMEPIEPEV